MILRIFRVIVHEGREEEFRKFILKTALPLVHDQEGMASATVGLPRDESPSEFSLITYWRDLDSLKAFAGESWREAVVLPEEASLLRESHVHHYEVAEP